MRTLPWTVLAGLLLIISSISQASTPAPDPRRPHGDIIVRFIPELKASQIESAINQKLFEGLTSLVPELNLYLLKGKAGSGLDLRSALKHLRLSPSVIYAQADHPVKLREEMPPNDPEFSKQWNLSNPSTQVDIGAIGAWKYGVGGKDPAGNDIVIAVVDGGMDIQHPDLVENIWINSGEIPGNGLDDDGNGYVDDINGWNAKSHGGNIPNSSHGTHVAGIAGARGNNSKGVTGVNWNVKIMAVAAPSQSTSVIAAAYGYVLKQKKLWLESHGARGANVVSTNSSFGVDFADCQSADYPIWNDLYEAMGKAGILAAAATANQNIDVDARGDVPTGCSSDYIVSVTNTNRKDERNTGAAYGLKTIDLGAPGTEILSCIPSGGTGTKTGTSMSTPHIAGAIAFLYSIATPAFQSLVKNKPATAALMVKSMLLESVDPLPALAGITVSGGRLNLSRAAARMAAYR